MPTLSYQQAGLVLKRPGAGASDVLIRDLQRHLRALGYLRQGTTGLSGPAPRARSRACSTTSCTTTAAAATARRL